MQEDLAQAQFKSARNLDKPSFERTKRSAKRHVFKHIKYELNKDNLLNLKSNKMQYSDQTFDAIQFMIKKCQLAEQSLNPSQQP